jgi:hypothetical protein
MRRRLLPVRVNAFAGPVEQGRPVRDAPGLYDQHLGPMRPGDSRVFRSASTIGTVRVQVTRYANKSGRGYACHVVERGLAEAGVRVFRIF